MMKTNTSNEILAATIAEQLLDARVEHHRVQLAALREVGRGDVPRQPLTHVLGEILRVLHLAK